MARLMGNDFQFTYTTATGTFVPEDAEVVEYTLEATQPAFETTPNGSEYATFDLGVVSLRGTVTVNCTNSGDIPIPLNVSGTLKVARDKAGTSANYWQGTALLQYVRKSGTSLGGGPPQRAIFGWQFTGTITSVN